jgi:3-hydroxybutyryl-CoA dehydratase
MNIKVGDEASFKKIFSQEEVLAYSKSTMDQNPIHYDEAYSKKTCFKKPIVHGLFASSLFGGLLGSTLPGKGTIHLGQHLSFIKPVFVWEEVTALIKVVSIREDKPVITFKCILFKADSSIAIEGEAIVIYKGSFFR